MNSLIIDDSPCSTLMLLHLIALFKSISIKPKFLTLALTYLFSMFVQFYLNIIWLNVQYFTKKYIYICINIWSKVNEPFAVDIHITTIRYNINSVWHHLVKGLRNKFQSWDQSKYPKHIPKYKLNFTYYSIITQQSILQ